MEFTEYLDSVGQQIKDQGYTCVFVDLNNGPLNYTYSVGFQKTFGVPEVLIMSAGAEVTTYLIAMLSVLMKNKTKIGHFEQRIEEIFLSNDVLIKPVPFELAQKTAKVAHELLDADNELMVNQVILPDSNGLFPHEHGADSEFHKWQEISLLDDERRGY